MRPHDVKEIIISTQEINRRVACLVEEISRSELRKNFVMLGILRGSFMFMADLLRNFYSFGMSPEIDFITLASYGSETESSGRIDLIHDTDEDLREKDVLLVDDILDTGRTLDFARKMFLERGARAVYTCVLLNKKVHRATQIEADFSGFEVENDFVVGYGLDYDNNYRELPHIARVRFHDKEVSP